MSFSINVIYSINCKRISNVTPYIAMDQMTLEIKLLEWLENERLKHLPQTLFKKRRALK